MMNSTNTHWQWYKDFFKVTVFRYLITWFAIVPFFVKALDSIPKKVMFQTAPNVQIPINIEMPFHWQLLWLSSLAFVLSFALYKIFCPGFITKYPNYSKYLKYNHSPRWIVWESSKLISKNFEKSKFLERLMEKDYLVKSESSVTNPDKSPIIGTFQTVLYLNHNNETYELGMPILHSSPAESEQVTMVAEKEIFWEIFGRYARSWPTVRLIVMILLFISLGLFLWVLIENIYAGLEFVCDWLTNEEIDSTSI